MDFKVLLLCCLLAAAHSRHLDVKLPNLGSGIVGGKDAFPGQFPYQVSLQIVVNGNHKYEHFCGGTILNERWILTAANCIINYELYVYNSTLIVRAGKHDLNEEESSEEGAVGKKYFIHKLSGIEVEDSPYNIGLIKLKTPLKMSERIAAAVLPKNNSEPNGQVTLSGWGSINQDYHNQIYPKVLQTVTVPIIDCKTCNEAVKKVAAEKGIQLDEDVVHEMSICTGPLTGGISACEGDIGGPLVATNDKGETEVVGIVSWGLTPCERKGAPTIYVRVSSFIDWIQDIINNN